MKKFYITTPLYYVNDKPHIGHTYSTVLADVIARYHRLMSDDVFFLTGTDEHGQKIAQAAKANGLEPKKHCDIYAEKFKQLWKRLNISYDRFIRTTDADHEEIVKKALQYLYDKGDIYKGSYKGWYCVYEERFWTEKDLVDNKCPDCGRAVEQIEEENYFFRMSKYQEWLLNYVQEHTDFVKPAFRRNEVLGALRQPLDDLCISRPKKRLTWGIEIPFDQNFVVYVWFDALLNYISAVGALTDEKTFSKWWPAEYHIIGKDILTTHTVFWPIILRALDIEPPKTVFAHGWWLVGDQKMGKSLGNAIDPNSLVDVTGADRFRYFLMRDMAVGQDANYSLESFIQRVNNDLSNDLGNMLSRVTNMVSAYFDGILPERGKINDPLADELISVMDELPDKVIEQVSEIRIHLALETINNAVRTANRYIENTQPWQLAQNERKDELATVLFLTTQLLAKCGILLHPVIPQKSMELLNAIGYKGDIALNIARKTTLVQPGTRIKKPDSLFPRLNISNIEKALGVQSLPDRDIKETTVETKNVITIDKFQEVKLVVGKIVDAKVAPKSEKLLLLTVDIGEPKMRNLVAGVAQWYSPNELVGKKIVVVSNLKPTTIRGFESQGMLLAADDGKTVSLLTVDKDVAPGSVIK